MCLQFCLPGQLVISNTGLPKNMSITAIAVLAASIQILLLLKIFATSDGIFQPSAFHCIY